MDTLVYEKLYIYLYQKLYKQSYLLQPELDTLFETVSITSSNPGQCIGLFHRVEVDAFDAADRSFLRRLGPHVLIAAH